MEVRLADNTLRVQTVLSQFNHAAIGDLDTNEFLARVSRITDPANELTEDDLRDAAEHASFDEDPFADADTADAA